jgi:ribonuclease D
LSRAAQALAAAPEVALDTEGDSLHHYPERLALLQLARPDGGVWLVDPLAVKDLTPLIPVFAESRPLLLVHAGDNDLSHLKRRYGFAFRSIFDTAIAARFLGGKALGLDTLLETWLGVTLPPSRQRDDWSARPLTSAQIEYAAADVRHLFSLKERLTEELRAIGRLAWVEEECAALAAQVVLERPPDPDAWMSVKGARELSVRNLAALRELYELRESLARAADRPPFKILSEEILLELARTLPVDSQALATIRGVTPRVIGRWGGALLAAIQRAQAVDEAMLPQWPRRPRPSIPGAVSRRVEALRKWRAAATERIGLEPGVLLPNRLISLIAEAAPRSVEALVAIEGVRRWRAEQFGSELIAALERP